jgi:hypothetical protein
VKQLFKVMLLDEVDLVVDDKSVANEERSGGVDGMEDAAPH